MNKVREYRLYVQDGWLACILRLRHNNEYFVKYQIIVLEMQWMDLSVEDISYRIFGDGCEGLNCMDTAVIRPKT
jgi:hypothetical protein